MVFSLSYISAVGRTYAKFRDRYPKDSSKLKETDILRLGEWNSQLHRRNPPARVKDSVRAGGLCLYRRDFQSPVINRCFENKKIPTAWKTATKQPHSQI